jgi:hypothetical protein
VEIGQSGRGDDPRPTRDVCRPKDAGTPQDHRLAACAPGSKIENRYFNLAIDNMNTNRSKMGAFDPLPWTSTLDGDRRVDVHRFELFLGSRTDGFYENPKFFNFVIDLQVTRRYKRVN